MVHFRYCDFFRSEINELFRAVFFCPSKIFSMNELMALYKAKANSSLKKIIDILPLVVVVGSFGLYLCNQDKNIAITQTQIQTLLDQNKIQDSKLQNIQNEVDEIYKLMIDDKDDNPHERF